MSYKLLQILKKKVETTEANCSVKENIHILRGKISDIIDTDEKFNYDFYLYLWLKGHGLNPEHAEVAIRKSMEWRQTNNLYSGDEWPPGFLDNFSYKTGTAPDGSPVIWMSFGKMDMKRGAQLYGRAVWMRCWMRTLMGFEQVLFDYNKDNKFDFEKIKEPDSIKLILSVVDSEGFSVMQLASVDVIRNAVETTQSFATYFPQMFGYAAFINVNKPFRIVFSAISRLIATTTKLESYGTNDTLWQEKLQILIGADEITRLAN